MRVAIVAAVVLAVAAVVIALTGRYQIAAGRSEFTAWRIDRWTGQVCLAQFGNFENRRTVAMWCSNP